MSQNNRFITIVLFVVALVGYLPRVIQFTYKSLLANSITEVPVKAEKHICEPGERICYKTYSFDLRKEISKIENESLAVGIIFSASEWFCGGEKVFATGDKERIALSRITHNEYFTIGSNALSKCKKSVLEAKVYFPKTQKKSGIVASEIYLADDSVVQKFKSAQEFVFKDYKIFNLSAMFFLLFYSILIKIVTVDSSSKTRIQLSAALLIGAIAQSCVLEVFFPFSFVTQLNRWAGMLAYCVYLSLAAPYLMDGVVGKVLRNVLLGSVALLMVVHQDRVTSWIWFSFFASAIHFGAGAYTKNFRHLVLALLTFSTSLEFVGYTWVPNSYIVPSFLAMLVLFENQKSFSSFLKINRLLKLSARKKAAGAEAIGQYSMHAIVKLFQRQFGVERMTVLSVADKESIFINQYLADKNKPNQFTLRELPPVFAHVITTGNSLVNVHVDSKLVQDIRRGEIKHETDSKFFTVLPLYAGREVVGALALTKYGQDQFKTSLGHSTFMFCLDLLKGIIIDSLLTTPKTESLQKVSLLHERFASIDVKSFGGINELIDQYGAVMNELFGWRVAVFGAPGDDYQLKHIRCYSFDAHVEERFINGKIYAHKDNVQGPLAIAVHERKVVVVPNTKWLEGVVHQNTTKFFEIHQTKTAAFFPVLDEASSVLGVFWIEGIRTSEISFLDREMFNSLIKIMSEQIKLFQSHSKLRASHEGLSRFLPEHLVGAYLSGQDIVEKDHGFLMMFDLKGSTRLSNAIGNASYVAEVDAFRVSLLNIIKEDWVLRQFVWDGFEFTRSSPEAGRDTIDVAHWESQIVEEFYKWKNQLKAKFGERAEIMALSYRICFTFGDISRGVVEEGETMKWALIGNAIAVATKVEQASKQLEGTVFCDKSMLNRTTASWKQLTVTAQGLVVFGLIDEQKELKSA